MARVSHDDGATWVDYSTIDQAFANADDWGTNSIVELLGDCVLGNTFTFTGINAAGSSPFNLTIRKAGSLTDNPTLGAFATISDSYIVFSPAFGGSLTVEGIDFLGHGDNSSTTTDGGIFRITNGTASFSGCKFTDCQARNGGAISHDSSGDLTVTNSQFYSCQCTDFGGAIYTVSANATVTGCDFRGIFDENNPLLLFQTVTTKEGGAISHDSSGDLTVTNTNISGFYCETGGSAGGGIFSSGLLTLDNVTISHCAAYYGGGVYSLSNSTENAVTLKNGTSITRNMLYEGEFTLIMPNNDPVTLSNNRLDAAGVYMTGIIVLGDVNNENDTITISGNTTESGKPSDLRLGTDNGLGLRVRSNLGTKEGKGEIFIANPSGNGIKFGQDDIGIGGNMGGGSYDPKDVFKSNVTNRDAIRTNVNELYWRSYVCKITDADGNLLKDNGSDALYTSLATAFTNFASSSHSFTDAQGASATPKNIEMLVEEYTLTTTNGTDNGNIGIKIRSAINVTLKTAAKMWGPDTYGYPQDAAEDRATIKRGAEGNSLFAVNGYMDCTLTVENLVVDGQNLSSSPASAFCFEYIAEGKHFFRNVDFVDCVSSPNNDGYGGGAILARTNLQLENCRFTDCSFTGNNGAGAIGIDRGRWIEYFNTTTETIGFFNCTAKGQSGAMGGTNVGRVTVRNDNGGTIMFYKCKSSSGNGGAIRASEVWFSISEHATTIFEECSASGMGGAIYSGDVGFRSNLDCINRGTLVFKKCESDYGGACYIYWWFYFGDNYGTVLFDRCAANYRGGAIYGPMYSNLTGVVIYSNCHAKEGGAIFTNTDNGSYVTGETHFRDCYATLTGGAIHSSGSKALHVQGIGADKAVTFTNCKAVGDGTSGVEKGAGGGIYSLAEVNLEYVRFGDESSADSACTARYGGGIHAKSVSNLNHVWFHYCSAISGGGIYQTSGSAVFDTVVFSRCSAAGGSGEQDGCGGGTYLTTGVNGTFSQSQFDSCTATRNGGGIYNAGTLSLKDFEITGCNAATNGGGIYHGNSSDNTLNVSDVVKIYGNTRGAIAKDGTANNVYLENGKTITIASGGLECGSRIGITKTDYSNDTYGSQRQAVATGTAANCLDAFRKGFFFDDTQTSKPYCFNYDSYTTGTIYFVKSWNSLSDESGISVDGNTITVNTAEGLAYIAKTVNEGYDFADKTILLNSDLNLGSGNDGKLWIPIGCAWDGCSTDESPADYTTPFRGTFDGQGHTISGLTSYLPHKTMGLFGAVGQGGEVKNVFVEGGEITATYVPEADESAYVGGLVGQVDGGTVRYCESATALTSTIEGVNMGGLVGTITSNGLVHSSMAMADMTGNNSVMGGLVGNLASGTLANSFSNASITVSSGTPATGGLVGTNGGTVTNCYARLRGTAPASGFGYLAGSNAGTISNSYIPAENSNYIGNSATAPSGCNTYTPTNLVNGKYGFGGNGQVVGSSTLVDLLNAQVDVVNTQVTPSNWAAGTYAKWTRTMASPINDDYPVLLLGDNICLGSKTGSNFIGYGSNLNNMIAAYNNNNSNGGGNIYLYDVPEEVTTNTSSNVRVYIPEDFGILQGDENSLRVRAGVTIKNTTGNAKEGASASWHMFSSALSNAPLGLVYHTSEDNEYMSEVANNSAISDAIWSNRSEFDPPMTTWNTTAGQIGYFPTNTPYGTWRNQPATNGFFDLYAYSEENYHWMNLKREGTSTLSDHWHTDRDNNGNHQKISYTNGTTMPAGKGYLLALSEESMLMADGVLNNGTKTVTVTKSEPSANVPSTRYTPDESKFRSINLVGNPYQSYLDFDAFAAENTMLENMYATRSGGEYIYYTADASANGEYTASQYVHPHQGFFVRVSDEQAAGSYTVTFSNTMRRAGTSSDFSSPYRSEVNYPLINLLCYDTEGHRDLTTVEVNRPEQGGGHKMEGLRTAEGTLAAQLGAELFQTAFVPEGTNEVPVRFEAYEDGQYTIRWNTLHGTFRYLHLIDNMTGADVDCLTADGYTFKGKATDYTSRFKLVFDASEDEDGASTGSATFAYYANGEIVITADACDASLQVIDMLGRVLRSTDGACTVSTSGYAPGVYVLRLISGESVKTQKIVIR